MDESRAPRDERTERRRQRRTRDNRDNRDSGRSRGRERDERDEREGKSRSERKRRRTTGPPPAKGKDGRWVAEDIAVGEAGVRRTAAAALPVVPGKGALSPTDPYVIEYDMLFEKIRFVVGEYTRSILLRLPITPSYFLLLLVSPARVYLLVVDARHTRSGKLPPSVACSSPSVSRCLQPV